MALIPAEDYLHEAALANAPPSGTTYDPEKKGARLSSLGVHEHWNNPQDKRYSRNLGRTEGIELLALHVGHHAPNLALRRHDSNVLLSWPSAYWGYQLQHADSLTPAAPWKAVPDPGTLFQGQNVVSNALGEAAGFYRLAK